MTYVWIAIQAFGSPTNQQRCCFWQVLCIIFQETVSHSWHDTLPYQIWLLAFFVCIFIHNHVDLTIWCKEALDKWNLSIMTFIIALGRNCPICFAFYTHSCKIKCWINMEIHYFWHPILAACLNLCLKTFTMYYINLLKPFPISLESPRDLAHVSTFCHRTF